ncbi:type VI secretion system contractile sheath small subunit [Paraburkholderia sediminicola]|uniref:type VI secretion system contractile sheath small subunit n=1 Tax=Paraburkholderia sediminicola TaxID=458836 RepID=UPI0038BA3AA5
MSEDDRSVAPKERVNIVYKSTTDGAKSEVELPMKQLVLGDFTQRESDVPLDEQRPVQVDKDNFNDVLKAKNLSLDLQVPDQFSEGAGKSSEALTVSLKFERLVDFEPDSIVQQVPELRALIELRDALKALKGPLGNLPDFRKQLQHVVKDEATRARLLSELGVETKSKE